MTRPVRATINTHALAHNFSIARAAAGTSQIMAVIKANAYGHGIVEVAKALSDADAFAVASLEEALTLIDSGIRTPIILLEGFFEQSELQLAIDHRIQIVLHNRSQIELVKQTRLKGHLSVWVKFDTGMHRLGFKSRHYDQVLQDITQSPNISQNPGLMSHFACADEPERVENKHQSELFSQLAKKHNGEKSLANSASLLSRNDCQYDWVRPGIMLYGSSPFVNREKHDKKLQPVMSLTTKLIAANQYAKGDAIGYGGSYICDREMHIGVAAIGYGDGYPRHAPTGTPVWVNDQNCSLIGRVSMDMITIDLGTAQASVGDTVELWGQQLSIDEVAGYAGTISYELLCHITPRVKRYYVDG